MREFSRNYNFIFLLVILYEMFLRSSCADNNSAAVSGIYDTKPYRTLNYKGNNLLQCNITGVSKLEDYTLIWFQGEKQIEPKEDDPHFELRGNDLLIKAVTNDLLKPQYRCDLRLKSKPKDSISHADFSLLGKLTVKIVSQGTFIQGQKILLECQVQGYPEYRIEWRYENTTFVRSHGRVMLKDDEEKGLVNNFLEIDVAEITDRGEYACKASNEHMNAEAVLAVRIKDKYAALWPFIGICVEVIVLCAVIFIYERKRNKAELEESDTEQSPEQKNTPDHAKESVRQRK